MVNGDYLHIGRQVSTALTPSGNVNNKVDRTLTPSGHVSSQFALWFYLVCAFSVSCIFTQAAEFRFFFVFFFVGFRIFPVMQRYCVES